MIRYRAIARDTGRCWLGNGPKHVSHDAQGAYPWFQTQDALHVLRPRNEVHTMPSGLFEDLSQCQADVTFKSRQVLLHRPLSAELRVPQCTARCNAYGDFLYSCTKTWPQGLVGLVADSQLNAERLMVCFMLLLIGFDHTWNFIYVCMCTCVVYIYIYIYI